MSAIDSVKSRAKEVLVEDIDRTKTVAISAGRSGAYLYPIKGIFYFLSHRDIWKPLLSKLIPTMTLSVGVIASMFIFTYLPQVSVLFFVNGPLAAFTTVLLILSESSTIITIVSKNFLIADALVDTFDGVLVAKNKTDLVSTGRQLKSGSNPMNKLGKVLKSPFERFTPKALIRYLMYMPLNFIPVVGTAIFVLVQGKTRGTSAHSRYFQLKKWSESQKQAFLKENVGPYTAFGTVATLLELIPVASILFSFTNTVGAALWAVDIDNNDVSMTTAPNLRETVKKAE